MCSPKLLDEVSNIAPAHLLLQQIYLEITVRRAGVAGKQHLVKEEDDRYSLEYPVVDDGVEDGPGLLHPVRLPILQKNLRRETSSLLHSVIVVTRG